MQIAPINKIECSKPFTDACNETELLRRHEHKGQKRREHGHTLNWFCTSELDSHWCRDMTSALNGTFQQV